MRAVSKIARLDHVVPLHCGGLDVESNSPPDTGFPAVLLLRRLRPPDLPYQYLLRHQPLRRVRITAAGVDGVETDVENVPAAETPALEREISQIGLHPLRVG